MEHRMEKAVLEQELTALRRDFHKFPESGWTEFRTTARIMEELEKLGLPVGYGREIHVPEKMLGLPKPSVLESCWQRAAEETERRDLLETMRGGFTGCVTVIEGALPGPTVGIRVDMDCNDVEESREESRRPVKEGFRSLHEGCMHACGHDAHTAIGIGIAKVLSEQRASLRGRVLLAFQPAEEGLRGAASLTAAGVFDECDFLFGLHVGLVDAPVGTVAAGCRGFLASSKFDVTFHGRAAHAGLCPEEGRNAVAAAAKATLDLLDIPSRSSGFSRVNVGTFHGGSGRNVIPAEAEIAVETRGETTEVNREVEAEAVRLCEAAAKQYGCTCEVRVMGAAGTAVCDPALAARTAEILERVEGVREVLGEVTLAIGEDITTIMERVQQRGGQATELIFAMPLAAPHHNGRFDVAEEVLGLAVRAVTELAMNIY